MRVHLLVLAVAGVLAVAAAPQPLDAPTEDVPGPGTSADAAQSGSGSDRQAAAAGEELEGTFVLTEGSCSGDSVSGSWFRMVTRAGSPDTGPYVSNNDSRCDSDDTYTLLRPGTDGGLATTGYQPNPDPPFDDGDALAEKITLPESFFGTDFAVSTNPTDPQTGTDVQKPVVTHDGDGNLDGDVRAFSAAWNGSHFNQGAPKPDGSQPGNTAGPTGTYDPSTGAFTLEWTSQIEGGQFDGFTGVWHLEGTFEPAESGAGDGGDGGSPQPDDGGGADTDGSAGDDTGGDTSVEGTATDDGGSTRQASSTGSQGDLPRTGPATSSVLALGLLALGTGVGWLRRRPG